MNKKKIVITIIIVLILLAGLGVVTYLLLNDKDKLTVEEKEWLTQNQTVVQSIYVVNNVDVYGKNGEGVFYDFIKSLENEYTLDVNEITYNSDEKIDGKGFKVLYEPTKNSVVFHEEHFVIISKEKQSFSSLSQLSNKKIGYLLSFMNHYCIFFHKSILFYNLRKIFFNWSSFENIFRLIPSDSILCPIRYSIDSSEKPRIERCVPKFLRNR